MSQPIHVHPHNHKLFEFREKPLVLITATEHYGAVMNRPFRFERYLEDAADKHMTLTRLFLLFRELQSPRNPHSTCKPDSSDYVTAYSRSGTGRANDGEPKFNLDHWNPEFFTRLHAFLSLASQHGIVVEVTLLSNTYAESVWALNPLNPANHVNDVETITWPDYLTLRHPRLVERQMAYVRKIVTELNSYDNIFFEVCNEPGGGVNVANSPSVDEVNRWQNAIANTIRATESHLPHQHMIVGQEAFTYEPWEQSSTQSFEALPFDVVNIHPLPNTTYRGCSFDLGEFMSKQLKIRALRDYCLATHDEPKPVNMDEDNIASQYMDVDGWTIHRKRAWTTVMSGCHYDYIDFSVNKYVESGNPGAQQHIRRWMGCLSAFVHNLDLVHAHPIGGWLQEQPTHTLDCVLAIDGDGYCVYLADERELGEPGCGDLIRGGEIMFDLPTGRHEVACYLPESGAYSVWWPLDGGPRTRLKLPDFRHDIVVRIRRNTTA